MKYFFLISMLFTSFLGQAQFIVNGNAEDLGDNCYHLTKELPFNTGSIWNEEKISLENSFDVNIRLNFGCKDGDGADGIFFGFQPISTGIGSTGGGIGFSGISPSIGIEFDSHQNTWPFNDPVFDHVAIVKNGDLDHNSVNNLAGPIAASAISGNIEDCEDHTIRVTWNGDDMELNVYFDCILRLTYTGDLVNDVFAGDPLVYWGFTAATGGLNNFQTVCLDDIIFFEELEDINLCPGAEVQLNASTGIRHIWSPETGLSNPNISNPVASPIDTITYVVEITDFCEQVFFEEITINVGGEPTTLELGKDTMLCEDESYELDAFCDNCSYLWNDESTNPEYLVTEEGTYSVTITNENCSAFDKISFDYLKKPIAYLGEDTSICEGNKLIITPNFDDNATYTWQDNSNLEDFVVLKPGQYRLSMINDCGIATDEINIEFEDCRTFYAPNIFTPNGDSFNDSFTIFSNDNVLLVRKMSIFDRWGSLVFQKSDFSSNDVSLGWDGTFNGNPCQSGTYTYLLILAFKDNSEGIFQGSITIVR